ncbi:MAG: prepilin-type N-terminal cleavage/methylation domain-containing protein [Lachnospiraceae bacterium]|nr:prepilin-type N-terminal cleavage/methylation domain-containing protein [Lachnospiraceae bacterium]
MKENQGNSIITEECKKNQNAGFTLVELLIAMMITLIIITAVGQFMSATSRTYQIMNNQVDLQMEAQCTINMIADMVLEGNNVVFDKDENMLRIYKNLGTLDSSGNPVDYRSAEQNIIWFDKDGDIEEGNMYLFVCKDISDYTKALAHDSGEAKLMAEGIESFVVTSPKGTNLAKGLSVDAKKDTTQQDGVTVSVKLKTKAVYDSSNDDDFTYEAVDTIFPRNEIVEVKGI